MMETDLIRLLPAMSQTPLDILPLYSASTTSLSLFHTWCESIHVMAHADRFGCQSHRYTPAQADIPVSCAKVDTCPKDPGNDPLDNYMNYVPDTCMNKFKSSARSCGRRGSCIVLPGLQLRSLRLSRW
jgi:hypothetical protein